MRDFQAPGRSLVYATQRHVRRLAPADGAGRGADPPGRRQRRRCRDRGGGLSGFAEPPDCGIGGDCFVLMKPAGEERLVGLNGSGRAPAGLDAEALRAAGHRGDAADGAAAVTDPRRGRRLRAPRRRLGPARPRRLPRAGDPLRRGRGAGSAARRARLGAERGDALRRGPALLPPRRRGAGAGQIFRAPAPGRGAAPDRPRRPRRLLRRRGRRGHGRLAPRRSAAPTPSTTSPPRACTYVEPIAGDYRGHELVELPPNGAGRHRDPAGEDPRPLRPRPPRPRSARRARISRPRRRSSPTTPATASSPIPAPARSASPTCSPTRTADALAALIDPGPRPAGPGRGRRRCHRETVYLCVVDRDRMAVSLIYSTYHSLRLRPRLGAVRHQLPQPRRRLHADAGPSQRGRRRQAADAHDHPGDAPPRRPAGDAVRGDGRRLPADGPRPAAPTSSTSAWTRRRRSTRRAASPTPARSSSRPAIPERSPPSSPPSATASSAASSPLGGAQAIVIGDDAAGRRQRSPQGRLRARLLGDRQDRRVGSAENSDLIGKGWPLASVQMPVEIVAAALAQRPEHFRDLGMVDGLAGIVADQVLLRDISHVIRRLVLGEQVVERLVLARPAILRDRLPTIRWCC